MLQRGFKNCFLAEGCIFENLLEDNKKRKGCLRMKRAICCVASAVSIALFSFNVSAGQITEKDIANAQ